MGFLFHRNSRKISLGAKLKEIISDIIFLITHILHFIISKLIISLVAILLGILFFLPVFLLAIIFMWIDPISWGQIFYFVVTGQDISLEIVSSLAEHPYWLVFEIFLIISAGISFLLFSSYSNFLFMRLARSYIERKPVEFMHNEYLSKNFIFKYAGIVSFIFALFLAPAIIITGCVFFLYYFLNIGYLTQGSFEIFSFLLAIVALGTFFYLSYRIMFAPVVLAHNDNPKGHSAREFIWQSIQLTKGSSFFLFVGLLLAYILIVGPFYRLGDFFENSIEERKIAYEYKSETIDSVDDDDMPYFKYITQEYKDRSPEELIDSIEKYSWISITYNVFLYLIFTGSFVYCITSFYNRILISKH